jgi:glycolate oxidase FAD binding subunit
MSPSRVEKPGSVDDLARLLADSHSRGQAVIPFGGSTRMCVGNVPERYDAAVDLNGLDPEVDHVPGDLTVVAAAGVRIGQLQERLARSAQRLPFETPEPHRATLGGTVASNPTSLTGLSFGGIRDWVLGMRIVLGDGTDTRTGGRVVKNVQGYDLHRLHTGAYGSLGVIAEVAFKLMPLPERTRTVAAWFSSPEGATTAAQTVLDSPIMPEALSVIAGPLRPDLPTGQLTYSASGEGTSYVLVARVNGGMAAVVRQVDMVTGAAGAASADGYEVLDQDEAGPLWGMALGNHFDPAGLTARVVVKPLAMESVLVDLERHQLRRQGPDASIIGHMGFGVILINWPSGANFDGHKLAEFAFSLANRHGGMAIIERCPTAVKMNTDVFGDVGASLEIMKRMKRQYDPGRVLNPGRFAGRI